MEKDNLSLQHMTDGNEYQIAIVNLNKDCVVRKFN